MALTIEATSQRYIVQGGTTKPTGVPIGSTCWDATANIVYKTYDGTNWVVYITLG